MTATVSFLSVWVATFSTRYFLIIVKTSRARMMATMRLIKGRANPKSTFGWETSLSTRRPKIKAGRLVKVPATAIKIEAVMREIFSGGEIKLQAFLKPPIISKNSLFTYGPFSDHNRSLGFARDRFTFMGELLPEFFSDKGHKGVEEL